jgi:hypothetical protein
MLNGSPTSVYLDAITFTIALQHAPPGVPPEEARAAIVEVLDSIGDFCPECPPE